MQKRSLTAAIATMALVSSALSSFGNMLAKGLGHNKGDYQKSRRPRKTFFITARQQGGRMSDKPRFTPPTFEFGFGAGLVTGLMVAVIFICVIAMVGGRL